MLHLMLRAFFKGHMTKIHHHWLFETVHAPRIFITQEVAGGEIVLISMSTASRDSALSDSCSTSQWTHPLFCSAVLNYLNANQKTFIKKKKKKTLTGVGDFWNQILNTGHLGCIVCAVKQDDCEHCETLCSASDAGGVGTYLQSIFSTRYAHIRKPVLLKPCVQWTPSGEKAAQWSKTETLHLY